jgi:hypothetical protein
MLSHDHQPGVVWNQSTRTYEEGLAVLASVLSLLACFSSPFFASPPSPYCSPWVGYPEKARTGKGLPPPKRFGKSEMPGHSPESHTHQVQCIGGGGGTVLLPLLAQPLVQAKGSNAAQRKMFGENTAKKNRGI